MSKPRIPRARSLRERLALDADTNTQSHMQTFAKPNDEDTTPTQTNTQAQEEASVVLQTEPETEAKSQLVQETNVPADTHVDTQADSQTHTQAQVDQQTNVDTDVQVDPFTNVKQALGRKKDKLENRRKRQTFWLSLEDIKAIEELHEATGIPKYQIVSEAIQAMYKHVLKG